MEEQKYYEMKSTPRGLALLMSWGKFDPSLNVTDMPGTEEEHEHLGQILENFGFQVEKCVNLKTEEATNHMNEFSKKFTIDPITKKCTVSCCLVVISSHGDQNEQIYTYDGTLLVSRLLSPLNDINCEALRGVPKIFILDRCRGDLNRAIATASGAYITPKLCDILNDWPDSYFISGCLQGYFSTRTMDNTKSEFLANFSYVLQNKVYAQDLDDIIKEVTRITVKKDVTVRFGYTLATGFLQMPVRVKLNYNQHVETNTTLKYKFMFNPPSNNIILAEPRNLNVTEVISRFDEFTLNEREVLEIRSNPIVGVVDILKNISDLRASSEDVNDESMTLLRLLYRLKSTKVKGANKLIFGDINSDSITILSYGVRGKQIEALEVGDCYILRNIKIRTSSKEFVNQLPEKLKDFILVQNPDEIIKIQNLTRIPTFVNFSFTPFMELKENGEVNKYYDVIGVLRHTNGMNNESIQEWKDNYYGEFNIQDHNGILLHGKIWNAQIEFLPDDGSIIAIKDSCFNRQINWGPSMSVNLNSMFIKIKSKEDLPPSQETFYTNLVNYLENEKNIQKPRFSLDDIKRQRLSK